MESDNVTSEPISIGMSEGAGDWLTSQFIASLCENNWLSVDKMTEENVRESLKVAAHTASRSVSYMSSKGMIDARKD